MGKIQTGLRLPEQQYNVIKRYAQDAGMSINQVILVLIVEGMKSMKIS